MATWQEGNGGALLAGLGLNNQNAPKAGDNAAALAYIRDNNDLQRSGANNIGLQALSGLAGLAGMVQQNQQMQRQKEFQQSYANAFQSGDRAAMRDLVAKYPDQFEAVQKGMGFIDDEQRNTIGNLAASGQVAASQGDVAFSNWLKKNSSDIKKSGFDPSTISQQYKQDPKGFSHMLDNMSIFSLGPEKAWEVKDKLAGREIQRGQLDETIRSNKASEENTRRGQNISAQNAKLAANSPTTAMQNYEAYSKLLKTDPQSAETFAQVAGIKTNQSDARTVQLPDGRTVSVSGKLHGAGSNAFYEGMDDAGNVIRVPASAISAPATSAANAQNYAMKNDIDAITGANADDLNFMTGVTGSSGKPAIGADVRSRINGDQRKLYNAAQRVQGRMQNQGVAAARDMGASGINTVAEAKMYFQGMPQIDYSSPEAMQNSIRDIATYTNNYNQQYNVNLGGKGQSKPASQPAGTGTFKSSSGITFKVE